jgi:hypothetical protein
MEERFNFFWNEWASEATVPNDRPMDENEQ